MVNGCKTPVLTDLRPAKVTPTIPYVDNSQKLSGFRDIFVRDGPEAFAKAIRNHKGLLLTDTTFRDAHQSLLATRVRTKDLLNISPFVSHGLSNLLSLENWVSVFCYRLI